jgi:hypothetical protein
MTNQDPIRVALEALEDSNELLRTIGGEGVEQALAQIHDNYNAIEALKALSQPAVDERRDLVPGKMHCARCKFSLIRKNLYVNSGTVGAGSNETEPCPNGCGPLWPVTWEQEAREGYEFIEKLFERAKTAEDALAALSRPADVRMAAIEECAKVAQDFLMGYERPWDARQVRDAIRALAQKESGNG